MKYTFCDSNIVFDEEEALDKDFTCFKLYSRDPKVVRSFLNVETEHCTVTV